MTDIYSAEKRSEVMRGIHSKNTIPELKIRKALHALGFRFRLHLKHLPGCPDVVLPKYMIAVQIRGCFWHQHDCKKSRIPKSNRQYWEAKLARNQKRDLENDLALADLGWTVIVIWECDLNSEQKLRDSIQKVLDSMGKNTNC